MISTYDTTISNAPSGIPLPVMKVEFPVDATSTIFYINVNMAMYDLLKLYV